MTLETQVASLVSATTDLSAVVNLELSKVRTENANFKTTVVEKAASATDNNLVVFSGTSGKNIKSNSRAFINDNGGATFDAVFIGLGKAGRDPSNCSVGAGLPFNTTGTFNTTLGYQALTYNTTGYSNIAIGVNSLINNTTGAGNVCVGVGTMNSNVSGGSNTAVGHNAFSNSSANNYNNCSLLGTLTEVTGNSQVQLGNVSTTTYVYGTVQNRSDERDKTDIRPTRLGLDFIKSLRPVDYRWDMRDSYRVPPPTIVTESASEEERAAYAEAYKKYQEANQIENIKRDGSKKGTRYHHGVIAQEVAEIIKKTGNDFGGFQDHKRAGGADVYSIGYDEFIGPLIKAVQELAQANEELKAKVVALEAKVA